MTEKNQSPKIVSITKKPIPPTPEQSQAQKLEQLARQLGLTPTSQPLETNANTNVTSLDEFKERKK